MLTSPRIRRGGPQREEWDSVNPAVLGDLDEQALFSRRTPPLQGWLDGKLQPLPDEDGAEAVLVARVIGSPELEQATCS